MLRLLLCLPPLPQHPCRISFTVCNAWWWLIDVGLGGRPSLHFRTPYGQVFVRTFSASAVGRSEKSFATLLDEADSDPGSASKQSALYEALVKENPAELIRRYESNEYAANEACFKYYVQVYAL